MGALAKLLRFTAAAKEVSLAASVRTLKGWEVASPAVRRAIVPSGPECAGMYRNVPRDMKPSMKAPAVLMAFPRVITASNSTLKAAGAPVVRRSFATESNKNDETVAQKVYQYLRTLTGKGSKSCLETWHTQVVPIIFKLKAGLDYFVSVTIDTLAELLEHIWTNIKKGYEAKMIEGYFFLFMCGCFLVVVIAIDLLQDVVNEEISDPDDPDEDVGKKTLKMGRIVVQMSKHLLSRLMSLKKVLEVLIGNISIVDRVDKALSRIEKLEMEVDELNKRLDSCEQNSNKFDASLLAIQDKITKHTKDLADALKEMEESLGRLKKN